MRFECTCRYRQGSCLGPNCQTTTPENAAGFQVLFSSVLLDDSSAECFVGFDGSLGNGWPYAGLRGFFLLANARSKLRR